MKKTKKKNLFNNVKQLFLKNKYIVSILLTIIFLIISTYIEYAVISRPFSVDRLIIMYFVSIIIGLIVFFGIKRILDFSFKNRFKVGALLFFYIILMGYNTSSIYNYNDVIQPDVNLQEYQPIFGTYKAIRSDEFLVDTASLLSTAYRNDYFLDTNNALMARDTKISFYPELPSYRLGIFTKIQLLGFLVFDIDTAFSFYCFLPFFLLFFGISEYLLIITKGNKNASYLCSILVTFSPLTLWWNQETILAYGFLALIFLHKTLKSENKIKRILYSILTGWAAASYAMIMYPAWMIPFGYIILGFAIYEFIINKENIRLSTFIDAFIAIGIIIILVVPYYLSSKDIISIMNNTVYPGARSSVGGYGYQILFYYFPSIFYTLKEINNPCEYSQYFSFFPLPLLISIIILIKQKIKKEKIDLLLLIITLISILLFVWNIYEIGIFAKLSLLYMSTPERSQAAVSFGCILLLCIYFAKYTHNKVSKKHILFSFIVSIVMSLIALKYSNEILFEYMNDKVDILSFIFYSIMFFLILINSKFSQKLFFITMLCVGVVMFVGVFPINKGTGILYNKPVSYEIQKINTYDNNKKWLITDAPLHFQSYALINGARVINSTNYYPNLELWHKFDEKSEFEFVYNRYAHIYITLTDDNTSFELIQPDLFRAYINYKEICKFDVDYIISNADYSRFNDQNFNLVYNEDGILIYRTNCN